MFTSSVLIALSPLLMVFVTSVLVMLAIAFKRNHFWNATLTVIGLNLSLLCVLAAASVGPQAVTELLIIDRASWFYMVVILVAALTCATFNHAYLERDRVNREEMYLLLLIAVLGAMVLVCSRHVASLFLGLEILSVPLYGMVAYVFLNKRALEAGLKYLVLSAAASACLLFGFALLYAQTGSLAFAALAQHLVLDVQDPISLAGLALVLTAMAFKLSLVPFHLWTPDVYQGASAPAGAFLATVAKVAVFAALWRLVQYVPLLQSPLLTTVLACLAVASIIVGNLLALMQSNIKRLLGYSSIAHFGYLMIALTTAPTPLAHEAVGIYLLTYVLATLAVFGVVALVSSSHTERDADALYDYRGLFWSRPYLSAVLTVCMLSLAGIPLTAGFIGKFYIAAVGVDAHLWVQLGALIVGSAIGVFYYLRVIVTLYMKEPGMRTYDAEPNWGYRAGGMALLVLATLVFVLGVYPQPVLAWLQLASM